MGNNRSKKETKRSPSPVAQKLAKPTVKATKMVSHRLAANHNETLLVD